MPKQLEFRYVFQSAAVKENTVNVFGETGTLFEKGTDYDELITLCVPKDQLSNLILYYNGVTPDGMVGSQDPASLRSDNAPVDISTIATWTTRALDPVLPQTNENGYYYLGDVILFQKDGSTSKSCWTCIKTTSAPSDPIPANGSFTTYYWPTGATRASGGVEGGYYGFNRISQPYIANVPPQTISTERPGSAKHFETVNHFSYWQESRIATSYTAAGNYYTGDLVIYNDTVYKVMDTNGGKVTPSLFKKGPEAEGVAAPAASLVDAPNGAYGFDWQGNRYIEGVAPNGDFFSDKFWAITTLPRVPTSTYTFLNWDNVKVHDKIAFYDDNIVGFKDNETSNTFMDDVGVDIYTLSSIYNANSKGFSLARAEKILASIPAAAIKSQLVSNGLAVDYTLDQMVHAAPVKTTPFNYAPTVQGIFEDALAEDMMRSGGPLTAINKVRVTNQSMGFDTVPVVHFSGDTLATNPEFLPVSAHATAKLGVGLVNILNAGQGFAIGDRIVLDYDINDTDKDTFAQIYVYGINRDGGVLSVTIADPGSGYTNPPSVPSGRTSYYAKAADGSESPGSGLMLDIKMTLMSIDLSLPAVGSSNVIDDGMRLKVVKTLGAGSGGFCTVNKPEALTVNPPDGLFDIVFASSTSTTVAESLRLNDLNNGTGYTEGDVIYLEAYNVNTLVTIPSIFRVAVVDSVSTGSGNILTAHLLTGGFGYTSAPAIVIDPPTLDVTASASVDAALVNPASLSDVLTNAPLATETSQEITTRTKIRENGVTQTTYTVTNPTPIRVPATQRVVTTVNTVTDPERSTTSNGITIDVQVTTKTTVKSVGKLSEKGRYSGIPRAKGATSTMFPYMGVGDVQILRAGSGFVIGDTLNVSAGGLLPAKFNTSDLRIYDGGIGYKAGDSISLDSSKTTVTIDSSDVETTTTTTATTPLLILKTGGQTFSMASMGSETAPFGENFEVGVQLLIDEDKDIRGTVTSVGGAGQIRPNLATSFSNFTTSTLTTAQGKYEYTTGETLALVSSYPVLAYLTVLNGGSGYTSVPAFSVTQTGTPSGVYLPPTVEAIMGVSDVTIVNGGSGYAVGDDLVFPSATVKAVGEVTAVDANGTIKTVTIKTKGSGYTTPPAVTLTRTARADGTTTFSVASLSVTLSVVSVSIPNGGNDVVVDGASKNTIITLAAPPTGGVTPAFDTSAGYRGSGATVVVENEAGVDMPTMVSFFTLGGGYSPGSYVALVPTTDTASTPAQHDKYIRVLLRAGSTFYGDVQAVDMLGGYHGYDNVSGTAALSKAFRLNGGAKDGSRISVPGFTGVYPTYTPGSIGPDSAISQVAAYFTPVNIQNDSRFLYHKVAATVRVTDVDAYGGVKAVSFTNGYGYSEIPNVTIPFDGTGTGAILRVPHLTAERVEVFQSQDKNGAYSGIGSVFVIDVSKEYSQPSAFAAMNGDLQPADLNTARNPNILQQLELAKPGSTTGYAHAIPVLGVGAVDVASPGQGYNRTLISGNTWKVAKLVFSKPDLVDGAYPTARLNIDNNGKVKTITILTKGSGYTKKPVLSIVWYDTLYENDLETVISEAKSPDQATGSGFQPSTIWMTVVGCKVTSGGASFPEDQTPVVSVVPSGKNGSNPQALPYMKRAILAANVDSGGAYYTERPNARVQGDGGIVNNPTVNMCVSDVRVVDGFTPNLIAKYDRPVVDCYVKKYSALTITVLYSATTPADWATVNTELTLPTLAANVKTTGTGYKYLDSTVISGGGGYVEGNKHAMKVQWKLLNDQNFTTEYVDLKSAVARFPYNMYEWVVTKSEEHVENVQTVLDPRAPDQDRMPSVYVAFVTSTVKDTGDTDYTVTSVDFGKIELVPATSTTAAKYKVATNTSLAECGGQGYNVNPSVLGVIGHTGTNDEVLLPPSFSTRLGIRSLALSNNDVGEEFKSDPAILIESPPSTQQALYSAGIFENKLDVLVPRSYGSGYVTVPNVVLSGGGGSGATAKAVMGVTSVDVKTSGKKYVVGDRVTFTANRKEPTGNVFQLPAAVVSSIDNGGSDLGDEITSDIVAPHRLARGSLPDGTYIYQPLSDALSPADPTLAYRALFQARSNPIGMQSLEIADGTSRLYSYKVGDTLRVKNRLFDGDTVATEKLIAAIDLIRANFDVQVESNILTKIRFKAGSDLFTNEAKLSTLQAAPFFRLGDYLVVSQYNLNDFNTTTKRPNAGAVARGGATLRICANARYYDAGSFAAPNDKEYRLPSFPEYKLTDGASFLHNKSPDGRTYDILFDIASAGGSWENLSSGNYPVYIQYVINTDDQSIDDGLYRRASAAYKVTKVYRNGNTSSAEGTDGIPVEYARTPARNELGAVVPTDFQRYLNAADGTKSYDRWVSTRTYNVGDKVSKKSTVTGFGYETKTYKSLIQGSNKDPSTNNTYWEEMEVMPGYSLDTINGWELSRSYTTNNLVKHLVNGKYQVYKATASFGANVQITDTQKWKEVLPQFKTATEYINDAKDNAARDLFGNILPNMLVNSRRLPYEKLVCLARGTVTGITLERFGTGLTRPPTAVVTSVDGTGCIISTSLGVVSLTRTWPGGNYSSEPTVYIDYPLHLSSQPEFITNSGAILDYEIVTTGTGYRLTDTIPNDTQGRPQTTELSVTAKTKVTTTGAPPATLLFDKNEYSLNPTVDGTLHGLNFPDAVTAKVQIRVIQTGGAGPKFVTAIDLTDGGSNYRVNDILEIIDNAPGGVGRGATIRVTQVSDVIAIYPTKSGLEGYYKVKNIGTGYVSKPVARVVGGAQGVTLATSLSLTNVDLFDNAGTSNTGGTNYVIGDMVYAVSPEYQTAKLVGKVNKIGSSGKVTSVLMFTPYLKFTVPPAISVKRMRTTVLESDVQAKLVGSLGVSGIQITFSPDGFVGHAAIIVDGPRGISNGYINASGATASTKVFRDISRIVVLDNNILYDKLPTVSISSPLNYDPSSFVGWYAMYFDKGDALDTIVQYSIGKALSFQVDPDATLPGKYFVAESITIGGVNIPLRAAGSSGAQGREMSANKVIHRYLVRYLAI